MARWRHKAFSFLELVMVTIILAIVAAIAAPRYANAMALQRLEAAAQRVANDLALAQRRAKFTSTTQTIDFDVLGDFYAIVGVQDPDRPATPYVVTLSDEPYGATIDSADFAGNTNLIFTGFGVPENGNGGTIVIRSGNRQKTITVDGVTGRATISDGVVVVPPELPQPPQEA
jgi:prepilin-type N-terminal cleavage/methylation domain-containing protein